METLRNMNYRYRYDIVVYENAGETFYVPYIIPYGDAKIKIAPRLTFSLGGTLEGNAHLQGWFMGKNYAFFQNNKIETLNLWGAAENKSKKSAAEEQIALR